MKHGGIEVDPKSVDSYAPLICAAAEGHQDIVGLFVRYGMLDVDAQDSDGHTSLSLAAAKGNQGVIQNLLLHESIDVNLPDTSYGLTPLCWASRNGHSKVFLEGMVIQKLRNQVCVVKSFKNIVQLIPF